MIVEAGGEWTPGKGYTPASSISRIERRSDFQGYPMKGVGVKVGVERKKEREN